ncbi:MAG: FAD-dependent oxidoreductase [Pseudomonadota bacterium]
MAAEKHPVVVIGAGIVGLSTAIWLARLQQAVTLIDRDDIGGAGSTSFGNAGVLACCSVAPVTGPGLALKGPKLLMDPDFPLFVRWSYLPKLAPWLARYLSHANDKDTRRIAGGIAPLIHDSVEQHRALAKGTAADDWIRSSDYAFAYPDRAAFEADRYVWDLRRDAGFLPEVVEGKAVKEREPGLSDAFGCLAVVRDHGMLRNPSEYLKALAREARALGVKVLRQEVVDVAIKENRITAVITRQERHDCHAAVLATGVWSKPLAQKLGVHVPLESERGYHLHIKNPGVMPGVPLMITTGKFVATPMDHGLRCAGVVEFGGLKAGPSKAPLALLRKRVREAFPDVQLGEAEEWLGHRPAPSDSLPILGEIGKTGVFAGFGHHHIGMTAGPKTGRILAGLITNNRENLDLSPYRPDRFAAARK